MATPSDFQEHGIFATQRSLCMPFVSAGRVAKDP